MEDQREMDSKYILKMVFCAKMNWDLDHDSWEEQAMLEVIDSPSIYAPCTTVSIMMLTETIKSDVPLQNYILK